MACSDCFLSLLASLFSDDDIFFSHAKTEATFPFSFGDSEVI